MERDATLVYLDRLDVIFVDLFGSRYDELVERIVRPLAALLVAQKEFQCLSETDLGPLTSTYCSVERETLHMYLTGSNDLRSIIAGVFLFVGLTCILCCVILLSCIVIPPVYHFALFLGRQLAFSKKFVNTVIDYLDLRSRYFFRYWLSGVPLASYLVVLPEFVNEPEQNVLSVNGLRPLYIGMISSQDGSFVAPVIKDSKGAMIGELANLSKFIKKLDAAFPDDGPGLKNEMAVPDSTLQTARPLSCTVMFYGAHGDIIGNGFRVGKFVVTPKHVALKAQCWSGYTLKYQNLLSEEKVHYLSDYDVCWFMPREAKFSIGSVSDAGTKHIARCKPSMYVTVKGYSSKHYGFVESHGVIEDAVENGLCQYNCSSHPGMSGSPVFYGTKLVGMHIGSNGNSSNPCNYFFHLFIIKTLLNFEYLLENSFSSSTIPLEVESNSFDYGDDGGAHNDDISRFVVKNKELARWLASEDSRRLTNSDAEDEVMRRAFFESGLHDDENFDSYDFIEMIQNNAFDGGNDRQAKRVEKFLSAYNQYHPRSGDKSGGSGKRRGNRKWLESLDLSPQSPTGSTQAGVPLEEPSGEKQDFQKGSCSVPQEPKTVEKFMSQSAGEHSTDTSTEANTSTNRRRKKKKKN
jgi:hypothetical protein